MSFAAGNKEQEAVTPKRLELSVNPEDGSLLTAPLSTVLLASTDDLYTDLYNVAHGELEVTNAQQGAADEGGADDDDDAAPTVTQKKERMANLSFAQRRHELAWRLTQHGKGLTHVAALTAAAASTDISNATRVSTRALQHARTAWVQADEAQDALYFFHAQLFPARQAPHDVYGALDLQLGKGWLDMPTDVRLTVDRYQVSKESEWSSTEVSDRWHMAVRDKLLRGEVAWLRRQPKAMQPKWKVALRGGIVRLTQGSPKKLGDKNVYPIEALLTVLSTSTPNQWSLLSIEVKVEPKTGESDHQLEATQKQRYSLHRLCALAMAREEARVRTQSEKSGTKETDDIIARPLQRLFQVAHTFALSWQLEVLSAQAQALKRGNWASGTATPITVTPVQFNEDEGPVLGLVSISFWRVDDQYGPPRMGDISLEATGDQSDDTHREVSPQVPGQLTLSVRVQTNIGVIVSLSGAAAITSAIDSQPHVRLAIEELLDAASNPFELSASAALLAATRLCAERRCYAVVHALKSSNDGNLLPSWMNLTVERASISVSARVRYHGIDQDSEPSNMVTLFRLTCDARTGSFIATFSRSCSLLRKLVCNDLKASESAALRMLALPQKRRRLAGANNIGRAIRDAFDGLCRSMNAIGQRAGLGSAWQDRDGMSSSLRLRAIHAACSDTRTSLIKCSGMASVYALAALSLGIATGVSVSPDMAGDSLGTVEGVEMLPGPPVSIMLDQLLETSTTTSDGEKKKSSYFEQNHLAVGCTATNEAITLYLVEVCSRLITPTSAPQRNKCSLVKLESPPTFMTKEGSEHLGENLGDDISPQDLMAEVEHFATILSHALE